MLMNGGGQKLTATKLAKKAGNKTASKKTKKAAKNPVFDHRRRPGEGPARNFESSYPRFPSIIAR